MHIIICADQNGRYVAERMLDKRDAVGGIVNETTFDSTWLDIANGQVERPVQVMEIDISVEGGFGRDASVRVAMMVLRHAVANGERFESDDGRLAFIEMHLGSQRANPVRKVYPTLAARA